VSHYCQAAAGKGAARAVYIAPMQALATERLRDWTAKFGTRLGLNVVELVGEPTTDHKLLEKVLPGNARHINLALSYSCLSVGERTRARAACCSALFPLGEIRCPADSSDARLILFVAASPGQHRDQHAGEVGHAVTAVAAAALCQGNRAVHCRRAAPHRPGAALSCGMPATTWQLSEPRHCTACHTVQNLPTVHFNRLSCHLPMQLVCVAAARRGAGGGDLAHAAHRQPLAQHPFSERSLYRLPVLRRRSVLCSGTARRWRW